MPNILYPLNLRYAPITFKQLNQTLNFYRSENGRMIMQP